MTAIAKSAYSLLYYMSFLKRIIVNVIPGSLLQTVKKWYYSRAVRDFWEADLEPIRYLVKPGDFVIDIGANVGDYTTFLASLVGEHGKVYSIEPIPETFQLLSGVVGTLGLKNVQLLNYAISANDGSAVMEVPLHDYGIPNFYQARIVVNAKFPTRLRQYMVHVRSIDSLFTELPNTVSFVKCDVEGHELAVINGASEFLRKSKPAWLIEVGGDPSDANSAARDLFSFLRAHNYRAYWFDGERLKEHSAGDKAVNYLFLQAWHLGEVAFLMSEKEN